MPYALWNPSTEARDCIMAAAHSHPHLSSSIPDAQTAVLISSTDAQVRIRYRGYLGARYVSGPGPDVDVLQRNELEVH